MNVKHVRKFDNGRKETFTEIKYLSLAQNPPYSKKYTKLYQI